MLLMRPAFELGLFQFVQKEDSRDGQQSFSNSERDGFIL